LTLNCANNPPPPASGPIAEVGTATTANYPSGTSSATTPLPTGTAAGDVIVSYITTYPFSTVTCPSGYTQAFDHANGSAVSLQACWKVAGSNEPAPLAPVETPTELTMVTTAWSGASGVDVSASANGFTSPSVTTTHAGDMLVLGEGTTSGADTGSAPSGTTLDATVNDGNNVQTAAASVVAANPGASAAYTWTVKSQYGSASSGSTAAGTVALTPGSGGSGSSSGGSGGGSTSPLSLTTSSLPAATVGTAYSAPLAASGGTAPYTFSATGLPGGLSVSGDTISGTPTASAPRPWH
jgi:hypothetical protein